MTRSLFDCTYWRLSIESLQFTFHRSLDLHAGASPQSGGVAEEGRAGPRKISDGAPEGPVTLVVLQPDGRNVACAVKIAEDLQEDSGSEPESRVRRSESLAQELPVSYGFLGRTSSKSQPSARVSVESDKIVRK